MSRVMVEIPIFGLNGVERLPAELENDVYTLSASPGMIEGLAAGDQFVLDPGSELGFRVVTRSGNLSVWFFLPAETSREKAEPHPLTEAVTGLGGWLDGGGRSHLVFTVPLQVGFGRVVQFFDDWVPKLPGASWMFGNVYDPRDGITRLPWLAQVPDIP